MLRSRRDGGPVVDENLTRLIGDVVDGLVRDQPLPTPRSNLEALVTDFAKSLTVTPSRVSSELRARLQEHFDADELQELAVLVAGANADSRKEIMLRRLSSAEPRAADRGQRRRTR